MAFKFNKTLKSQTNAPRVLSWHLEMSDNGNVSTLKYVVPPYKSGCSSI